MEPNKPTQLRSAKRIKPYVDAFIRYEMIDLDGVMKQHNCPLEDISLYGMKLKSYEPFPVGSPINIRFFINRDSKGIKIRGETRWCLELDQVPTYWAGIKLVTDHRSDMKSWRLLFQ